MVFKCRLLGKYFLFSVYNNLYILYYHLELFGKIANIGKFNVCHANEIVIALNEQPVEHIDGLEYIDSDKMSDHTWLDLEVKNIFPDNNDLTDNLNKIPSKDITSA